MKAFAVVIPKSGLAEMSVRDALGKVPDTALQVAYFATVEEGKAWLAKK